MPERRKILLLTASILISITTILVILFYSPYKITRETFDSLTEINPYYLALAIGMHAVSWILWGCRLRIMGNFIGTHDGSGEVKRLSLPKSLKIIFSSLFAACITPSQFGGEPVRIYLLNKHGFSVGDGTAVVLGERVLDFVVIAIGTAISFLLFRAVLANNTAIYVIFTVIGALISACVMFMAYAIAKPEKAKKLAESLLSKIKSKRVEKIRDKIFLEIDNFFSAINRFRYDGKSTLGLALFLTAAFWLIAFLIPSFLLLGLGADPVWIYSIAAQFILTIIVAVPITPGGSGIAEVSVTALYHSLVGTPILGVFMFLWRLCTYYLNLFAGGITSVKVISEMR
ncbi:MAG TPA: flippase-like domain-containing protein [Methanophagales archaeon]|nr:flippase-like domain-containing protein [Methanophagales archaeon]